MAKRKQMKNKNTIFLQLIIFHLFYLFIFFFKSCLFCQSEFQTHQNLPNFAQNILPKRKINRFINPKKKITKNGNNSLPMKIIIITFIAILCGLLIGLYTSDPFRLTLVNLEEYPNARCIDGSPGGYYYYENPNPTPNKIYLQFQGGSWAQDIESAYDRSQTHLGSSNYWSSVISKYLRLQFGIWSQSPVINPELGNANHVWFPYCDGCSFGGTTTSEYITTDGETKILYHYGDYLLSAMLEMVFTKMKNDLDKYYNEQIQLFLQHGFDKTPTHLNSSQNSKNQSKRYNTRKMDKLPIEIMISGCSAGGVASLVTTPKIKAIANSILSPHHNNDILFTTIPCSGVLVDIENAEDGEYKFNKWIKKVYDLNQPKWSPLIHKSNKETSYLDKYDSMVNLNIDNTTIDTDTNETNNISNKTPIIIITINPDLPSLKQIKHSLTTPHDIYLLNSIASEAKTPTKTLTWTHPCFLFLDNLLPSDSSDFYYTCMLGEIIIPVYHMFKWPLFIANSAIDSWGVNCILGSVEITSRFCTTHEKWSNCGVFSMWWLDSCNVGQIDKIENYKNEFIFRLLGIKYDNMNTNRFISTEFTQLPNRLIDGMNIIVDYNQNIIQKYLKNDTIPTNRGERMDGKGGKSGKIGKIDKIDQPDGEGKNPPSNSNHYHFGAHFNTCFTHCEGMLSFATQLLTIDGVNIHQAIEMWLRDIRNLHPTHQTLPNNPNSITSHTSPYQNEQFQWDKHVYLPCKLKYTISNRNNLGEFAGDYQCNDTCIHNWFQTALLAAKYFVIGVFTW
jgi:hypothetical protein